MLKKNNITNVLKENINLQLESPRYEEGPLPAAEYWVPPPPLAAGPDPIQSPVTHHSKQRQIGTHKNMTTVFKINPQLSKCFKTKLYEKVLNVTIQWQNSGSFAGKMYGVASVNMWFFFTTSRHTCYLVYIVKKYIVYNAC